MNATIFYDGEGGIKEITNGMVVMVHDFWVRTWSQTSNIRRKRPRKDFARSLASFLIDDRKAPGRNVVRSTNGRGQSIPRIESTKIKSERRTQGVSPGLLRDLTQAK